MDCRDVRQRLPRYLDERLPQDEQALVQAHLQGAGRSAPSTPDGCAACRRELEADRRTGAVIGAALSDHPFGDAAVERLLEGLPIRAAALGGGGSAAAQRQRGAGSRRAPGGFRSGGFGPGLGLPAAAAAALLLAGGVLLLPRRAGPDETTVAEAGPAPVVAHGWGLLRRTPEGGFETLSGKAALYAGEVLVAVGSEDSPARVELLDQTRLDLHADTELSLRPDADGGLTLALGPAGGEVFCQVAPRKAPFRVSARNLEVEVVGTRFLVHQGARVSRVVVHEGAVLASAHGQRRRLGPDDAAEARPDVEGLECLRVTALQHGLWVPGVREEARAAALSQQLPGAPAPTPPAQPPAPVGTSTPAVDPNLDVPVVPPTSEEQRPGAGKLPGY